MSDETVLTGAATEGAATEGAATEGAAAEGAATEGAAAEGAAAEGAAAEGAATDPEKNTEEGADNAPEAYADFVMPEGTQLDDAALTEASPLFKELNLNQEQAQKVVDLYVKQVQAGEQKNADAFNQLTSEWRKAAENDKEFGGDKFDENIKIAQHAVDKYGTSGLKELLDEHGIGSHPEMVRFMVRVGHTLKEDVPGAAGNLTSPAEDRINILYPNATKK